MSKMTNPASRLLKIVQKLKSISTNKTVKYSDALHDIFKLEDKNFDKLFRYSMAFRNLVFQVEKTIQSKEDINHKLYLKHFGTLKTIVNNPNMNFDLKGSHLSNELIYSLEHIENLVSGFVTENEIQADILNNLISEIEIIYENIKNSEINNDLKMTLLELSMMMRNSIHEYEILGADGIQEAISMCYGKILKMWGDIKQIDSEENKKVAGSLFNYLCEADKIISFALNSKALMSDIVRTICP